MNTQDLEWLLEEAADIASERREKASESHMAAMMIRNSSAHPSQAEGWQMAADYALRTARVIDHTADLASEVIALRAKVAAAERLAGAYAEYHRVYPMRTGKVEKLVSKALAAWEAAQ